MSFTIKQITVQSMVSTNRTPVSTPTTASFDNLESYSVGDITILSEGTGWDITGTGIITAYRYFSANDSFESYATGSITTFSDGTNWASNGAITS